MLQIRNILYVKSVLPVILKHQIPSTYYLVNTFRTNDYRARISSLNHLTSRALSCSCNRLSTKRDHQLSEDVRADAGAVTVGQKVKQAGKDVSYVGILLFGFAVTGSLVWYVLSELLFSFSPNSVYSKALKIAKRDSRVIYEVGDGMKGYGEETSRGRRRHVNFQEYIVDGVNHMRVQFYISGQKRKATVHAEARETSRGNFEFRYIFIELQGFPPSEPIIILDNR